MRQYRTINGKNLPWEGLAVSIKPKYLWFRNRMRGDTLLRSIPETNKTWTTPSKEGILAIVQRALVLVQILSS